MDSDIIYLDDRIIHIDNTGCPVTAAAAASVAWSLSVLPLAASAACQAVHLVMSCQFVAPGLGSAFASAASPDSDSDFGSDSDSDCGSDSDSDSGSDSDSVDFA